MTTRINKVAGVPSEVTTFKVKCATGEFTCDFTNNVICDPVRLAIDALELPATRHYVGHLTADAQKALDYHKAIMERYAAQIRNRVAAEAAAKSEKMTVQKIQDAVTEDETYFTLTCEMIDLEETVNRLETVLKAVDSKRDVIQTISANLRSQQGGVSHEALEALQSASQQDLASMKRNFGVQ